MKKTHLKQPQKHFCEAEDIFKNFAGSINHF